MKTIFIFTAIGKRNLLKLPKVLQKRILKKIKYWEDTKEPLCFAVSLQNELGHYRFRIGDYRIICSKNKENKLIILAILSIKHRKDIYKQK